MRPRQPREKGATFRGQANQHTPSVCLRSATRDQPHAGQPVDELNSPVVLQQHLIGEFPDHDVASGMRLDDK
jgi:hypothetical protein